MSQTQPYQPLLLRLLHGLSGVFVLGALLSGFWIYNTYDGRFGRLPLPSINDVLHLHESIAIVVLFILPFFALYSFHPGQRRLIQPDSFTRLAQVGRPIWWYSLNRIVNTLLLLALALAVMSGGMMEGYWLPTGQLNQKWYVVHLSAWVFICLGLALHFLLGARIGGWPLLVSMVSFRVRPGDRPQDWLAQVRQWWQRSRP